MVTDLSTSKLPKLIQGGMGIAISGWKLARAVASRGQMGVVSGTAIDRVVACRLQEGDQDGTIRQAAAAFPDGALATRVLERWFKPEGLERPGAYKPVPLFSVSPPKPLLELATFASFCEVWLAKRNVRGPVGINLLEKIQAPTLPILYGALLAGVDTVLMGAGIPREIPGLIDQLCAHEPCALKLNVENGDDVEIPFDPSLVEGALPVLKRPQFLAIVSSHVLAISLSRSGGVDGFIVEGPIAGGHNAAPRGWKVESGDTPRYGPKDEINLERIKSLGLPFWLAGGQDAPHSIAEAEALGAQGVQVGTAFAFCSESGMEPSLRHRAIAYALAEDLQTKTEGRGSPTGYPFKTLNLSGTEGGRAPEDRERQSCNHGYLRSAYRKADGSIGWRCAAEPEADYLRKGGKLADCVGRRCLCNGLLATAGFPHAMKGGGIEYPLVTSGIMRDLHRFLKGKSDYDASDVLDELGIEAEFPTREAAFVH
ncbi:nitronate monooxygenase [Pelagicoccus sp. NFK12]|uniref:Nitronate monooxygenase n=1 Tax=Pelagicoccus enzymogenes TaxID=2773457 RepID=A0A927F727_9BACT|nr:nitronate monooxygenase [Pelagicoccus enzymogenes]MBD5778901.1 nitronate monooxygenase [Pelagicoccus enzymogenes]MDQ8197355.1 nitronate monooxygenase [Pelagicoccus enzymogenes]